MVGILQKKSRGLKTRVNLCGVYYIVLIRSKQEFFLTIKTEINRIRRAVVGSCKLANYPVTVLICSLQGETPLNPESQLSK